MSDHDSYPLHEKPDDHQPGWRALVAGWLAILDETERPRLGYTIRAALLSFIPALIIGIFLGLIFRGGRPDFDGSALSLVLQLIVIAPWIETLLMIPILWLLKKRLSDPLDLALASGVVWGVIHALSAPVQGIAIVWPFVVFTTCFLAFDRTSRKKAIFATACVHMLHNLVPTLLLIASR
jgi:Type II CAAX prenyl endopeptidase Rce1-like